MTRNAPCKLLSPAEDLPADSSAELDDSERTPREFYTRVMGYHWPASAWNYRKIQEHADRVRFIEPETCTG
jgi:hypothetical protein